MQSSAKPSLRGGGDTASVRKTLLAMAACAVFVALILPAAPTGGRKAIRPFLVYYGGVPQPADMAAARSLARRMRGYPLVVLGLAAHAPAFAAMVRRLMPGTLLYGYADTGHVTLRHVAGRLALFQRLGFQGVLLDDIGTGLSAQPGVLRRVVLMAHRRHLRVLLNAWNPVDLLTLPLQAESDGVLCENWVYSDGHWAVPRDAGAYRALRELQARRLLVFMIVTLAHVPSPARPPAKGVGATARAVFGDYLSLSDALYSADSRAIFPATELRRLLRRLSF